MTAVKIFKPEIYGEAEFRKAIETAIKTSEHVSLLEDIVTEFEWYKKFTSENLIASTVPSKTILTFRPKW